MVRTGMLILKALGAAVALSATALIAACQSSPGSSPSPTGPTPVTAPAVANYAGQWTVVYHVDSCLGRYCYISHINRDEPMTVRLVQIGDRVTGLLGTADVEGFVAADGTLSLRGYAPATFPWTASYELKQFDVRLDPERGLTGRIDFASLMSGDYSSYSYGATGPIVSGTRQPLDTASFNGAWRGYYDRTACNPATSCISPEKDNAELQLQEAGGAVSGTVTLFPQRVQVTGRRSGDSVELRGQYPWGVSVTVDVVVRVQRSMTGRLTGTAETASSSGETKAFTLLNLVPGVVP